VCASESSSAIVLVVEDRKEIPCLHKHYFEFILEVERRWALRVFEIERAQERKDVQVFGEGARAIVRSSPYFPEAAALFVDGQIQETFRGERCWIQALKEANRMNEFFKSQENDAADNSSASSR